MRLLLILLAVALLVWQCREPAPLEPGPGITAEQAPRQVLLQQAQPFDFSGHRVTPLAEFSLQARVLSRRDYRWDRESRLSPTDLALGWGQMSDSSVLSQISIRQSGRWYHWRVSTFPIPRRAIETQSANMHIVPADDAVRAVLKKVRPGHLVALEGYLVQAQSEEGWRWKSSLSREDTGANACELVYVTALDIVAP